MEHLCNHYLLGGKVFHLVVIFKEFKEFFGGECLRVVVLEEIKLGVFDFDAQGHL